MDMVTIRLLCGDHPAGSSDRLAGGSIEMPPGRPGAPILAFDLAVRCVVHGAADTLLPPGRRHRSIAGGARWHLRSSRRPVRSELPADGLRTGGGIVTISILQVGRHGKVLPTK